MSKSKAMYLAGAAAIVLLCLVAVLATRLMPKSENTYTPPENPSAEYNMNFDWKFYKPSRNTWPLKLAANSAKDNNGKLFYEVDYDDSSWETVSVPHTFNDEDIFDDVANDAGEESLYRGIAFYRKHFSLPASDKGKKVFIEFEGIRQAAYVYVNGDMVGYYEAGVSPFGFDLSKYVKFGEDNVIAVAVDNTGARGMSNYMKETKPGTEPGSNTGVAFQWNTKDFNPVIGGLTRNVKLYVKNDVYQTLPLYSNLKTKGTYVYCSDVDTQAKRATISVEAEVRNESDKDKNLSIEVAIVNHKGEVAYKFSSSAVNVPKAQDTEEEYLTVVPEDAYRADVQKEPIEIEWRDATTIKASANVENIRLWYPDDPYLYDVYVMLKDGSRVIDVSKVTTGFRKVEIKGGAETGGVYINDKYYWLTGYAQRSTNEWAAIGVAPDWLKEYDAQLIKESNANFIRWMHIAAQPADIRACDKYGIVCVQPAGDKEGDVDGRNWDQRVEAMRDVIIYFRNSPSILFWEAGNSAISAEHMQEMVDLRKELDPYGMRAMGCRSLSDQEVVDIAEYVGTMLGRNVRDGKGYTKNGELIRDKKAVIETEYHRDEAPRRVWDDYTPPDFDYVNKFTGSSGSKENGKDAWDLTSEDFVLTDVASYDEFYTRRMQSGSATPFYSAAAALCWSDSNQHGRQQATENARMSGRVDPVRIKKQSFYAYRVMQNENPDIFIVGHWNYPTDPNAYVYRVKNPVTQEYTNETALRDPTNKTVYVVASHCSKVELFINGESKGVCDKPTNTFLYAFPGINIMEHGYIEAVGYDENGEEVVRHRIETAGEPVAIRLTPVTGPEGLRADGSDIAFFDVEVVDAEGRVCPLDYERIDFEIEGPAEFLGGYNSGVKDLKHDKSYVYAECGTNRVFIRATREAGTIKITAKREGLQEGTATVTSKAFKVDSNGLTKTTQQVYKTNLRDESPVVYKTTAAAGKTDSADETSKPAANASDKDDSKEQVVKVYINGKEFDFGNGLYAYKMVGAYGPVIPLLEALGVNYSYDETAKKLTIKNGDITVETAVRDSSMYVNGEPGIINDWPEVMDNVLYVEISAVIPALNIDAHWGTDGVSYYIDTK